MADSSASHAVDDAPDAGSPDPETVMTPVVPRHQISYTEVMEMTLRGERRVVIQDINDEPPNSDQPISEPKPKPLERQGCANNFGWDLRTHPSKSTSGVQTGSSTCVYATSICVVRCKGVENDNPIRPLVTPAATTTLGD